MPSTLESSTENGTALFLVALVCPPLAVASIPGIAGSDVTTNIFLTLLGWVPGVLEAWYLISNPPDYRARGHRARVLSGNTYTSYSLGKTISIRDAHDSGHKLVDHSSSSGSRRLRSHRDYGSRSTRS